MKSAKKIGETKDAEITPLTVDPSLTFNAVGGLDKYVDALKRWCFSRCYIGNL